MLQQVLISELEENVDNELFDECVKIVEKDINKWNSRVKSWYCHNETMPRLYYLGVDKRNQMHIGERHMVSEYMLIYLLKKNIVNEEFNIENFWDEIESLETKVEYIVSSSDFYEIPVNGDVVFVEHDDLSWEQ